MFGGSQSALVGIRKGLPGRQEKRSGGSNLWLSVSSPSHCSRTSCNVYRSSQWWKTWAKSATPFLRLTFLASASSAEITTNASARIVANSVTQSERIAIYTFPFTLSFSLSSRPICTCGALNSRVSLEAQTAQAGRELSGTEHIDLRGIVTDIGMQESKCRACRCGCSGWPRCSASAESRWGCPGLPWTAWELVRRPPSSMTTSECSSLIRVIGRSFRVGGVSGLCKHLEEIERMTIRDIQAHLERALGTVLSHHTISNNIEAVAEEVKARQGRPLEKGRIPLVVANSLSCLLA